jgi:cellulose synthase/poly-beta-1,6-N-acetylglucosamine synthase-like glycosyltransferase
LTEKGAVDWNKWVRQTHRWLSIVFTTTVVANFAAMALGNPPMYVRSHRQNATFRYRHDVANGRFGRLLVRTCALKSGTRFGPSCRFELFIIVAACPRARGLDLLR